jgi:uncharacterized protein YigE (DUF2233 family)
MLVHNGEFYNDVTSVQNFDHILRGVGFLNSATEITVFVTVMCSNLYSFAHWFMDSLKIANSRQNMRE